MTRTRFKSIPGKGAGIQFFGYAQDQPTAVYDMADKPVFYERIDDENNRRSRPQSPCEHLRVNAHQVPVSNFSRSTQSLYGLGFSEAKPLVSAYDLGQVLPRPDLVELRQAANSKVISQLASVAERWSSFNDLLELGEIPDLFRQGRNLRNSYLTVEFGWIPVLRWLESLENALLTYKDRLKKLKKDSGQKTRFNFRIPSGVSKPDVINVPGWNTVLKPERYHVVARTTGYVTVTCPALDAALDNVKIALDVIGFHPDILAGYDAMRFSWLLDWFLPVGDFLEQFTDRRWIRPTIVASEGSLSYRIDGWGRLLQVPDQIYPDFKETDFGTATFKVYHRESFYASTDPLMYVNPKIPTPVIPKLTPEQMLIMWGLIDPGVNPVSKPHYSLKPRLRKR